MEALIRCTTQVWTVAKGQVAAMASGKPVRPSQQTMSTSRIPRLASSAQTPAQNLAPSVASTQIPSTCLMPSISMWGVPPAPIAVSAKSIPSTSIRGFGALDGVGRWQPCSEDPPGRASVSRRLLLSYSSELGHVEVGFVGGVSVGVPACDDAGSEHLVAESGEAVARAGVGGELHELVCFGASAFPPIDVADGGEDRSCVLRAGPGVHAKE